MCCSLLAAVAAAPAAAQEMITSGPVDYDLARVSGFIWRGDVNGNISASVFDQVPGFEGGFDVKEDLGFDSGGTGWLVGADVGVAARHRFVVTSTGIGHSALSGVAIPGVGDLISDSEISIRDIAGGYKYIFSSRSWINAGAIVGLGYFTSTVDIAASLETEIAGEVVASTASVSEVFASPYPLIGASVLFKSQDVISIYAQITGSPSVEVDSQSGWVMNIDIDFIVYATPNIGIIAGYKRYQLSLEEGAGVAVNLTWDGYVVGGQYVF
jgi:hypothetical protein